MNKLTPILDFIFPPRCIVTGDIVDQQGMISPQAWAELNFISDPKCTRCGIPFGFLEDDHYTNTQSSCVMCLKYPPIYKNARSVFLYDDASRHMVLGFKHGDQTQNAPAFAVWLERAGQDILPHIDYIIPVPLHPFRLMKRRFNQSGLLAQALSKKTDIPVLLEGLKRIRSTPVQGYLQREERKKNVRKAFKVNKRYKPLIKNRNIVLIDDVFTTGATINECTRELLKNEAGSVSVLTLARVVKPV